MNPALTRRIEQLERALSPATPGPCFVMAFGASTADRHIARLKAEF
jgi:hypothetical protein